MIVCHCLGVSDRVIRRHVREGATNCALVVRACQAGGRCGGCRPVISEIIENECAASDPGPGAAILVSASASA